MKIGILQTGHAPDVLMADLGDYSDMFAQLLDGHGFEFTTWNVVDMEFPAIPSEADGWLITGSRHGAYEDHPFIPPLEDFIRAVKATDVPMIGVCFGHQIIAQALGGTVEKFSGGWSVGRTEYQMDDAVVSMNAWHQDQVVKTPKGARTLASSDFCEHAILTYGDTIWTVQPHPEFGSKMIGGLTRTRGKGVVPDALLNQANAQLNDQTNRLEIGQQMAEFFLSAHAKKGAMA